MGRDLTRVLLVVSILLLWTLNANARDRRPPAEVNRLAELAIEAASKGRLADAIRIWEDLLPDLEDASLLDAHYNLARAHQKLGRLPEAWHHLTWYLRNGKSEDLKAGRRLERTEAALKKGDYVKVAITCEPERATLYLDSEGFPRYCPLTWWFKPGKHRIRAEKKDFKEHTRELDIIQRGGHSAYTVRLEPAGMDIADAKPDKQIPIRADRDKERVVVKPPLFRPDAVLAWSLVGGGAASIITAGILHGLASGKDSELRSDHPAELALPSEDYDNNKKSYNDGFDDDVKPKLISAYVLYGAGAVAAATGAVMLFVNTTEDGDKDVQMSPTAFRNGTGLSIGFDF